MIACQTALALPPCGCEGILLLCGLGRTFSNSVSIMFLRQISIIVRFQQYNQQKLWELIFSNNTLIRISEPEYKDEVQAEYCSKVPLVILWLYTMSSDSRNWPGVSLLFWLHACHIESPSCRHTCWPPHRLLHWTRSDVLGHGFH